MFPQDYAHVLTHSSAEKLQLFRTLATTIQKQGFAYAWNKHLKKIVQLYHRRGKSTKDTIKGYDLFALMQQSPELKAHFESLPQEALADLTASFDQDLQKQQWDSPVKTDFNAAVQELYAQHASDWAEVTEADGNPVQVLENEVFRNWGRTVEHIPRYTCFPKSKVGVQNIVKYAKKHNKKVRVSGYRHTWGNLYSANDEILISSLSLRVATHLPAPHPPLDPSSDLQGIEMVGTIVENGETKGLCKIGAATTNEHFRRWATGDHGGNPSGWTVPLNVIMVEITWGGSISAICHGAGLQHKCLSDQVYEIEYVDPNGALQTVTDPELLKAAAGCFGLLGVVTSITLKLDKMTYAKMRPYKQRVGLTIPPPAGMKIPAGIDMTGIEQADLDAAWERFVSDAENSYFSEWFWFAFQKDCWVNCWNNDGAEADAKPYPSKLDTLFEEAQTYIADLIVDSKLFHFLTPEIQTLIIATSALMVLPKVAPHKPAIVTPLIDGLHFKRGIQNLRVYDLEWEIPIPARADDPSKPDWTVCQKAWWAVINVFYDRYNRNRKDIPMRLTVEMRIMGDSEMIMAPQHGNKFGTCAIEVLTLSSTPRDEWKAYLQEITSIWESFTDSQGNPLNIRPHWAKEWEGLKVRNMEILDYLKQVAYKDQLPKFKKILQLIAEEQGFTLADMQSRFSNPLIDNLFEPVFSPETI